jgi:phage baseplate assembly protein W
MSFRKQKPIKPQPNYADISTNFSLNAVNGDVVRLTEMDAVKRAIKNLVMTDKYERLLDPRFGAGINALLFEPMTPMTTMAIRDTIENSITTYEPRADLITLDVVPDEDENVRGALGGLRLLIRRPVRNRIADVEIDDPAERLGRTHRFPCAFMRCPLAIGAGP